MSVRELLNTLAATPSRIVALSDSGVPVSAAELLQFVADVRASRPLGHGRWALYFEDSIACAAHVLALWEAGGQPCLAPNNLTATCAAMGESVDGFFGEFPDDVAVAHGPQQKIQQGFEGNPSIAFFTSGSSGTPQCIEKHASQLFNEVSTLERCFGDRLGDSLVVSSVSHQHIYGFLFRLLWPLISGHVFAAGNLRYTEALTGYPASRMTWVTSPTHLTRLPPSVADSRVATIFSSGAPLPEAASRQAAKQFDAEVIEVFGSTETGGIGWRCQHRNERTWQPFDVVQVKSDDQDILHICSPHLPEHGWYRCDDRVKLEGQRFALLGRADRIVKVEGKRVSLEQLENLLLASDWVADVRIEPFRRQGQVADRDELLVLAVLTDAGAQQLSANRRELIAELKVSLGQVVERPLLPRRWRFIEQLPRNPQGKLEHYQLQQLVQELLMETACG